MSDNALVTLPGVDLVKMRELAKDPSAHGARMMLKILEPIEAAFRKLAEEKAQSDRDRDDAREQLHRLQLQWHEQQEQAKGKPPAEILFTTVGDTRPRVLEVTETAIPRDRPGTGPRKPFKA